MFELSTSNCFRRVQNENFLDLEYFMSIYGETKKTGHALQERYVYIYIYERFFKF